MCVCVCVCVCVWVGGVLACDYRIAGNFSQGKISQNAVAKYCGPDLLSCVPPDFIYL